MLLRNLLARAIAAGVFNPVSLFANGEQGFILDYSDLSTMFQDAAGTIAAAYEQPVGRINDKSGRGNHISTTVTAAKPKLSARKNWLLATATLATQSPYLTAVTRTLSFTGTGSVALSGAAGATGTLTGTGASNRVSLTFTVTAEGTVNFTVTGSVTDAQLEVGPAVTSYQSVVTGTNYATAGFAHFLYCDGADDGFVVPPAILNTSTAATAVYGMQHPDGVRTNGAIFNQWGASGSVSHEPHSNNDYYQDFMNPSAVIGNLFNAGVNKILLRMRHSGTGLTAFRNGVLFGNSPAGAFSRGAAPQLYKEVVQYEGNSFPIVLLGRDPTTAEVANLETWSNQKMGV